MINSWIHKNQIKRWVGIVGLITNLVAANIVIAAPNLGDTEEQNRRRYSDLRDLEQGLEQMKRIPSQDVDFELFPGKQLGQSDVVML